jgi:hypothetical protein
VFRSVAESFSGSLMGLGCSQNSFTKLENELESRRRVLRISEMAHELVDEF